MTDGSLRRMDIFDRPDYMMMKYKASQRISQRAQNVVSTLVQCQCLLIRCFITGSWKAQRRIPRYKFDVLRNTVI